MKIDNKKIIQLASLVGTDAKNPEEKLLYYIYSIIPTKDKVRQILIDKNWNKRSVDILLEELEEILI